MSELKLVRAACVMLCAVCSAVMLSCHGQVWAEIVCDTPTMPPASTPTPTPPAEIVMNGECFRHGDPFQATFQLNESVAQAFKAYAVVVLPDQQMLNALTLDRPPKPVVKNQPGLHAPFTYPLINRNVPNNAPLGDYEVMAGFFNPGQRITGPNDAFLLARRAFHVVSEYPTPTPTGTPIPNLSGNWTGTWTVTSPTPCAGSMTGPWNATVVMAADGTIAGDYHATGSGVDIQGKVAGYYDGTTATWTVCDQTIGAVSYSGQIGTVGTNIVIIGTYWDGPDCGGAGRTSGIFDGGKTP